MKFILYKTGRTMPSAGGGSLGLGSPATDAEGDERRWLDFFLIGLLTLLAHVYMVRHFHDTARDGLPITPVKVPPMVQVTLIPPPPPKPIVVQPPPPPPPVKKSEPPPKPKRLEPPPPKLVEPPPKPKKAEAPQPKKDVVALKPQQPRPAIRHEEPKEEPRPVEVDETPPAPVRSAPSPAPVRAAPPAPVAERVTPPHGGAGYLHNPAPDYPEMAEEEGWEGRVVLKVHVLANGSPDSVSVQKSSGHDILDQAAVRTVKSSWRFAPAMRGDTPTDGWVSVPIVFNLPG
jgi:protein TonB